MPVLASLRRAWPEARIDWLVQDTFADAVAHHPDLREGGGGVVPFPRAAHGRLARSLRFSPILRWLADVRRARYDLVLDAQGLARSGLFAWATGAPRRIGYANAAEGGWLGYTERHEVSRELHAVDRMLELVRLAGVEPVRDMRLYSDPAERERVRASLAGLNGPYALLAPTSRWPGKRWPADRFAAVARTLLGRGAEFGAVVVVGSKGERDQCGPLLELSEVEPRVIDRVGATSVGGLMALIEGAALVIANDSAALHMAVGFARPMIGLFGPTRVDLVGPYGHAADVVQHMRPGERLDHKDESSGTALMERITVEEVLERAEGSSEQ